MMRPPETATQPFSPSDARRPAPRHPARLHWLLLNAAMVAMLWLLTGLGLWYDRERTIDEAFVRAETLRDALAEQSLQQFSAIDQALLGIVQSVDPERFDDPDTILSNHALLADRATMVPGVLAFFLLNAEGLVVGTSRIAEREGTDLSDRRVFQVHRDTSAVGLYLGDPVIGRIGFAAGERLLNAGRRLVAADGRFAGIAAAAMSMAHIQPFYSALNVGPNGVVGLVNADGVLLARSPTPPDQGDVGAGAAIPAGILAATAPSGRFRGVYPSDGIRRLSAYGSVIGKPAIVYVGLSETDALLSWRKRAYVIAPVAGLLGLGLIGLALLLGRATRRRDAIQDALAESLTARAAQAREHGNRLAALARASLDLASVADVDTLLYRITELSRTLIAAHHAFASLTVGHATGQVIQSASSSPGYAAGWDHREAPVDEELCRLVTEGNRPMRLTQSELEAHPAWRSNAAHPRPTPVRGWLACPLIAKDGSNLGMIQLSDRIAGDFTETDLAILQQLSRIGSVAIENLRLYQALTVSEQEFRQAARMAQLGSWRYDVVADRLTWSEQIYRMFQRDPRDPAPTLADALGAVHPQDRDDLRIAMQAHPAGTAIHLVFRLQPGDNSPRICSLDGKVEVHPLTGGRSIFGVCQDVTNQRVMEEKLRQAQKMEVVGQLTGGLAHDFNNLLTVILGNLDACLEDFNLPARLHQPLGVALAAAERGAELTHQLLAFARRQPLQPVSLDVNQVVQQTGEMLRRTLRENIDVEIVLAGGPWRALADRGQTENALLSLALNAQDAMPDGGKLTIETANVRLDETYTVARFDVQPGQYVMVAVTDTGIGMPADVAARAFEPFYTTKAEGLGTGLGLSMVYGFVKQSGGHAAIYSEPALGTTVKLYLPRVLGGAVEATPQDAFPKPVPAGTVVLVVEDNDLVRATAARMLNDLGYLVIETPDGHQALQILEGTARVDLLFTDVVIPGGLGGRQLAEAALRLRPGIRVVYTTGYTENAIVHQGRLDPGILFVSKPYKRAELAARLQAALAAAPPEPGADGLPPQLT